MINKTNVEEYIEELQESILMFLQEPTADNFDSVQLDMRNLRRLLEDYMDGNTEDDYDDCCNELYFE